MKKIKLTQGKFTLVDDEDYDDLSKHNWYVQKSRNTFYAARRVKNSNGNPRLALMHREIMGSPFGKKIDHIDEDGLNNQKQNLRICTNSQNQMNRGKTKVNTSGYKGVFWHELAKKWRAQISINNERIYLGLFDDVSEAAKAYNEAAVKFHGEFARLNKVA